MDDIPTKKYFRIGEVSALTGVENHVIRYWESEFEQLNPIRAGSKQRLYSRDDIILVRDIHRLVHEEQYTLAGARKRLAQGPLDEEDSDARAETPQAEAPRIEEPQLEPGPDRDKPESGPDPDLTAGPPEVIELPPPEQIGEDEPHPNLPLFPEEEEPQSVLIDGDDRRELLLDIRSELVEIIKVLS